jgi:hypothetical protein
MAALLLHAIWKNQITGPSAGVLFVLIDRTQIRSHPVKFNKQQRLSRRWLSSKQNEPGVTQQLFRRPGFIWMNLEKLGLAS